MERHTSSIPLITGVTPKRKQADTFKDTIIHTAAANIKAATSYYPSPTVVQTPQIQPTVTQSQEAAGVSTGKAAEICGKSFDQLGILKRLFEDGILTHVQKEFENKILFSVV